MKTILLPDGVAESWYHITAGGETYESRVCRGSDILANLAELCFGSKDETHDVLDQYAEQLADGDSWCWCGSLATSHSLACGEDPDIEITLINDPAAIARLNEPAMLNAEEILNKHLSQLEARESSDMDDPRSHEDPRDQEDREGGCYY
jgi:hypothetical protein